MDCYLLLVGVGFNDLIEVVEHIVVSGGSIADNEVRRKQLRHFLDGCFVHVLVEASEQVVIIDGEHLLTCDFLTLDLGRKFDTKVKHNLE